VNRASDEIKELKREVACLKGSLRRRLTSARPFTSLMKLPILKLPNSSLEWLCPGREKRKSRFRVRWMWYPSRQPSWSMKILQQYDFHIVTCSCARDSLQFDLALSFAHTKLLPLGDKFKANPNRIFRSLRIVPSQRFDQLVIEFIPEYTTRTVVFTRR